MPAVAFIIVFAAAVFPAEYLALSKKENLLGMASVSLMYGIIGMGILAFIITPSPAAVTNIAFGYAPHAFNLIIWPVFALLVLKKRFRAKMLIPVLMFGYGLDEIIWNGMAFLRYFWQTGMLAAGGLLGFMLTPFWQIFFLIMVATCIVGYLAIRPKLKANVTLIILPAFGGVWALAGIPTGGLDPVSLSWELMWQAVFLFFLYATFWPRKNQ